MGRISLLGAGKPPAAGGAFDPASIFTGENAAWFDPSDLTTLFQNNNGTTAVTADGDPVGYMGDKSGKGNHATAPGFKPLYRTSGGLHWIEFDGTSTYFEIGTIDGTVSTISACMKLRSGTGYLIGITISKQNLFINLGTAGKWGGYNGAEVPSSYSLTANSVVIERSRAANDVDLFTNANAKEVKTNGTAYDANINRIGGRAGLQFAAMDFYGAMIILREISDTEVANTKTYLGSKGGIVL